MFRKTFALIWTIVLVPAPLILLLHGSGRDGWSLVKKWTKLAKKEGIILVNYFAWHLSFL